MSVKSEVLNELKKHENTYISGQELCQKLGVSRTAVWKHIKGLKEAGYEIESVSNRGYCLKGTPDVLGKEELMTELETTWIGAEIHYYDTIDSTNLEAKRLAEQGAPHGTLVVADCQNQGRGRRGRAWTEQKGTGIAMSLVLRPEIPVECSSMLTLVTALAVAEGIKDAAKVDVQIKWPNDIILHGKKVCGILTELSAQMDELNYVIVGIGINVNIESFPEEVKDVATSLFIEQRMKINRGLLVCKVLKFFEDYYKEFVETGDLSKVMDEYNELLIHRNKPITIVRQNQKQEVLSLGIDQKGELMVEDASHEVYTVISGEVSIRGILGYI